MSGSSAAEQLDLSTATFEAWQLVQIASEVHGNGGRVTLSALADLARGLGGGKYTIESGRRRGGGSGKAPAGIVDLSTLCDGKVTLSKDVSVSNTAHSLVLLRVADTVRMPVELREAHR